MLSLSLAPSESEPSFAASAVVTLLPLVFVVAMFVLFLRVLRRSAARAEESLRLSREIVGELKAIRAALERDGAK
jgi:hypothetical protein